MNTDSSFDAALAGAIFTAAVDGIILIDTRGHICAVNAAAQKAFGYSQEEMLGRNVSLLMPAPDAAMHDHYLDHYHRTGERGIIGIGRDVYGRRKDGSEFPLYLSIGEYTAHGKKWYVGICHDASERRDHLAHIAHLARHDSLTGVANRHHFIETLQAESARAQIAGNRLAALFIDLDGFKQINDRHGHGVGDQLLREVAQRLQGSLEPAATLGRLGGDEFGAILPAAQGSEHATAFAQRLRDCVTQPFRLGQRTLMVSASIGISLYPEHSTDAEGLMHDADIAMYHAKQSGSGISVFQPELRRRMERRYELLEKLKSAQALGQLSLHYQPQFDVATLQVCGLEALMRWHTPEDGSIPPKDFIPLAIEHGLMPEMTAWAVHRACTDNAALIRTGILDVPVAVNICLLSLDEAGFATLIRSVLEETGLAPERLEIEITEDVAMGASQRALQNAMALRSLGVGLAMDDFGVGFSSLGRLKSLAFGKLKIDRSFIAGLPHDLSDQAIVNSICGIGAGLGMSVLAEGVETPEQLAWLRGKGCAQGQGYWYARPMPLAALQDFLQESAARHAGMPLAASGSAGRHA